MAESEVFLAAVRLQQPTLFETSATALSSSSSTVASCSSGVALAPETQPPKRRRTWVPRWPRRGSLPTTSCATEERLDYAALLWREFVALGDHGSMWPEYVTLTAQLQEAYRKLTLERLRTFASGTLRSALATLTRWRTWSHDAACTGPPTTLLVALWLRSLQDGSPTSAHTTWTALRWLESHLGFVFHTATPSVKAWSAVGDQGEVCQAVPLSYQQWLLIETRALESDGLHRQLLASWLLMLYGMVRFEHLQHSKIWIESGVLTGLAQHGKTRRHGGRRPLRWQALSEGLTGSLSAFVACCLWSCRIWLLLGELQRGWLGASRHELPYVPQ